MVSAQLWANTTEGTRTMTDINPNQLSVGSYASVQELDDACLSTIAGGHVAPEAPQVPDRLASAVSDGARIHIPAISRGAVCPMVPPPDPFFSPEDLVELSKS
jgi:hypothetical protein